MSFFDHETQEMCVKRCEDWYITKPASVPTPTDASSNFNITC